jgi:hypothetical protein
MLARTIINPDISGMSVEYRQHQVKPMSTRPPHNLNAQTGPTQLKAVDEPEAYASIIDLTEE